MYSKYIFNHCDNYVLIINYIFELKTYLIGKSGRFFYFNSNLTINSCLLQLIFVYLYN